MTDPFWSLTLEHRGREGCLDDLVPQRTDDIRYFEYDTKSPQDVFEKLVRIKRETNIQLNNGINIEIREQRAEGVFDLIGGELWEASLLLSAYILLNPEHFLFNTCLELGTGVGLPSLLLATLKQHKLGSIPSHDDVDIYMTDYESILLDNLHEALLSQFKTAVGVETELTTTISLNHLDWIDRSNQLPGLGKVSVVYGSALIYSPDHASCADVIRRYLCSGCEKVIIVQMSQRAGFSKFISNLSSDLALQVDTIPVPEAVYLTAQAISIKPKVKVTTKSVGISVYGSSSSKSSSICCSSQVYHFPSHILSDIKNMYSKYCEMEPEEVEENSCQTIWQCRNIEISDINDERSDSLIKSDIDLFVFVHVSLKS